MKCKHCQQWMFDYMDKAVSKKLETAIDKHLSICPHCSAVYTEERRLYSLMKESMDHISSSLSVDDIFVERLKARTEVGKVSIILLLGNLQKIFLHPVRLILVLCIIPVVIWLLSSQTPGPEVERVNRTFAAVQDFPITDSLTDWQERRLVIIVRDEKGKITDRIVTSYNNEEIISNTQTNGTQNNGG